MDWQIELRAARFGSDQRFLWRYSHNQWFFFAQQIGFLVTSLIGIRVWIIDPLLGRLFREPA
ncbi:hypothetical protein RD110_16455 [Rhodoferax koreense]|uniref:Uncharacterized protein n=1 Tax=Rhodoferax koreensis TaxID=1842727 RepID=A0A1P8JXW2_9BURK|nr:hypothetical protein RD110_16455 [Rhodoferax koreense]